MAIKISFFSTPKHRVFHYTPRYYDETKERIKNVKDEVEREKAEQEGKEWKNEKYIPGKSIRGSMRRHNEKYTKSEMKPGLGRVITLVSLVIIFVMIYYFANYFGWFISLMK